MLNDFYKDLEKGKEAEVLVKEVFTALTNDYIFEDVSNCSCFFYCGDIKAIDKRSGKEYFIEVKNDSRIADTGNVLCEYEVYYKKHEYYTGGNMFCDSDIYVVVSQEDKKIYVIDFKILKDIYKWGEHKVIEHPQQTTYCYLLPIGTVKKMGGLIATIDYSKELAIAA